MVFNNDVNSLARHVQRKNNGSLHWATSRCSPWQPPLVQIGRFLALVQLHRVLEIFRVLISGGTNVINTVPRFLWCASACADGRAVVVVVVAAAVWGGGLCTANTREFMRYLYQ